MLTSIALIGCTFLLQTLSVDAHPVVYVPTPTWTRANSTSAERQELWKPLAFLEGQGFTTQANFTQFLVDNGYKSLRDFMDNGNYSVTKGADQSCGWTDPKGIAQQIPEDGTMRTSGYTHDGPCEIYMGDELALSYLNCHESITSQPFKLDYSACGDSCVLYWYWLGVRFIKGISWQVYKECIPIYKGSGGALASTNASEAPRTRSSIAGGAESSGSLTPSSSYETSTTESVGGSATEGSTTASSLSTGTTQIQASSATPTSIRKCNAAHTRVPS